MRTNYIENADCMERLKEIPDASVDLIVTDPPYGIDFNSRRFGRILNDKKPFTDFLPDALRVLKPDGAMFIFSRWDVQQEFINAVIGSGGRVKNVCVWDKGVHGMGDTKAAYGSRYESIIFAPCKEFRFPGKRPQDIIPIKKVPASAQVHPNEKPVALIERLITDASREGAIVLDPFMGSGTTAIACMRTGRKYIGFELDERYHALSMARIEAESKEKPPRPEGVTV